MADTKTLERRPGTHALRAEPTGWTAPEGSHAFVFGSDAPGWDGRFAPGDEVRIEQLDSYGAARLIRARARLRGPSVAPPTGWRWEAFSQVFADEPWTYEVLPGVTRDLTDLAINTQALGGTVNLQFGLRVVGPGGAEPESLEIPAFYLDELVLDEVADGLLVVNRSPEPGAVEVARDERILFDLMDTLSDPDVAATQVYVEGVLAYDGAAGGAQPGYAVSVSTPSTGTRRFEIVLPYLMDSLRTMDVRVVAANTGGAHLLDETWSFVVVDLTAPVVVSAQSRDHMTVRVTFDEPVTGADVAAVYAFERLEAPSVAVEAVSVVEVAPTVYDVTLDVPITRGALYRVTVSSVEDENGNAIAAPYDRAEFRGYECPAPATRRAELWRWIPQMNRDRDATTDLYRFVACLQEVFDLLLCDVDRWTEILDVDVAAERYLDQMLIGLGNPFAFDLSADDKRRLIRVLVDVYRSKGTKPGIISVVRFFLGIEIDIVAFVSEGWILGVSELGEDTYLAPGLSRERYSFEVVSPVLLTDAQRTRIEQIVEYMKPAHTHLVRIVEPTEPEVVDHLELGLSELGGDEWMLH
jgi:phage tail-like protein